MLKLLVLREQLRAFYGKHSTAITAGIRFLTALVSMICLNSALGYMKVLKSPAIVLVLALISSVCPFGGICWILALFMLAHIFAVSLELALITAAFLLVVALLYSWIMILTPLLFVLKIPYVAPLLVGLSGALVSVIPLSCGVVVFHLLQYVRSNAGLLTNGESVDITQKYMQMLNGIIMNRTMILYILAFAAAAIVVWLIRNQAFNQAWTVAVIAASWSCSWCFSPVSSCTMYRFPSRPCWRESRYRDCWPAFTASSSSMWTTAGRNTHSLRTTSIFIM